MKIGVLTGGGDCPGLNAVIRGAVRKSLLLGYEVVGIKNGWRGLLEKDYYTLDHEAISGILHRGGTILGSSRTNLYEEGKNYYQLAIDNFKEMKLDALIAIGGEDTLGVASKLYKDGVNIIGVPKTIDNDLSGTDYTFGFDTAINIATDAIDRLHTTAESHNRVLVVEVMGRHAGWIALHSGLAGGADITLIPEKPTTIKEICRVLKQRHDRGKTFSVVVVSEGAKVKVDSEEDNSLVLQNLKKDSFGHVALGGIGNIVAEAIENEIGYETRAVVLGHIQRGGTPTAFDRVLGSRFGIKAAELVHNRDFGKMTALRGTKIIAVSLEEAVGTLKVIDDEIYNEAQTLFG